MVSDSDKRWNFTPLQPRFVLRGFPGQAYYSDVVVRPNQMQSTLAGPLVAAQITIRHHRFAAYDSFTGRITSVYVLSKGPDAPDFGEALFSSPFSGTLTGIQTNAESDVAEKHVDSAVP